ncbi:hypothetical protein HELRODRAFT_163013 [Helobdella robusta]|uniref:Uncharacterized protein n=1 Tax=Helobdella robusta TaxID=6412 RepID=T1ETK3_HELRO|nr:hypothetical protein HELRODRAFT_163013 [Helobdella robusta]ESN99463.1 hypothetical protein HELRODRAFT_163013 [Helobdella robusta]
MDITCGLESVGIKIDPGDTCRILYIHMQGHLSRICFANSTWGEVDSNECLTNRMLDMENKITQFEQQITPVNSTELLELLNDLPHAFQNCETGLDVMTGVDILYKVANLLNGTEILNFDNEDENYIGSLKLLQTINMYSNKPRNKAWNRSSYLQPNEYLSEKSLILFTITVYIKCILLTKIGSRILK